MTKSASNLVLQWKAAWKERRFRNLFFLSLIVLALCGILAPTVFNYIENRSGIVLRDFILDVLPPQDLSFWIFLILYLLLGVSIGYLLYHPHQFLFSLQAYIILTILRFITLLLIPLDKPSGLILLRDPLVDHFFYQQPVTKDLFFSGHTSILFLLAIIIRNPLLRIALFAGTLTVAIMILFQHVHYTIDVIAAPPFAWIACRCVQYFHRVMPPMSHPSRLRKS